MRINNMKKLCATILSVALCLTLVQETVYATSVEEKTDNIQDNMENTTIEESPNQSIEDNESDFSEDDAIYNTSDDEGMKSNDENVEENTEISAMLEDEVISQPIETDVEEGIYYISTANAQRQVLDVASASKSNGGNVQLYNTNVTNAQKWKITFDKEGYATFMNVNSGKVLDVSGGLAKNSCNVQQYTSNSTRAQKWVIKRSADGYSISSALSEAYNLPIDIEEIDSVTENGMAATSDDISDEGAEVTTKESERITKDFVLDCVGGKSSNGTNIQIYTANDTSAQRFTFTKVSPDLVSGTKEIENGVYRINAKVGEGKCLDIVGGSTSNGANVQIYGANGSQAQSFQFNYDSETGCYTIVNTASGLVLDADNGNPINGTNVKMWIKNGSNAQKWAVIKNEDDTLSIFNRVTGTSLDISGGRNADGANVQLFEVNHSNAQKYTVEEVTVLQDGIYSIFTCLNSGKVMDVPAGNITDGIQMNLYSANATPAQKYVVHCVDSNTYTIAAVGSAKFLTGESGKVVQRTKNDSDNQKWLLSFDGAGIVIKNKETGMVMDCMGGQSGNGTKIQLYQANGTTAQRFKFCTTPAINNGTYEIKSAINNNLLLDVSGGNRSNGANIQVWTANSTNSQKFQFTSQGNDVYRITDVRQGRTLDVLNGSKTNGANVQLWDLNNCNAQQWKATITQDGWYTFTNLASGKCLDISGGRNVAGANVQSYQSNNSAAQHWHLSPTTKKIEDPILERAQNMANGRWSATRNLIMVDLSAHKVMVFQGSQWHWSNIQNWWCTNGAPGSPTVVGEYTVGSRGYSFGSGYTCYYYTQFHGNYLFHSVLYRQGTFNILDGRLGMALSHGCVRLDINCAKWIYDNIPYGTKVVTYY